MDPITQRILEQQRAIQAKPGFEGYQPSFSSLDEGIAALQAPTANESLGIAPMGIQDQFDITGVGTTGPVGIPNIGQMAKNIAINKAIDYGVKKAGLPAITGNILGTAITGPLALTSFLPSQYNPFSGIAALNTGIQSSLFGRSTSIAGYLQAKRDQKAREAAARRGEIKQLQKDIDTGKYGGGDKAGGGGFKGEGGYGSSAERGAALHG
jgi:hypothetical protein